MGLSWDFRRSQGVSEVSGGLRGILGGLRGDPEEIRRYQEVSGVFQRISEGLHGFLGRFKRHLL